VFCTNLRERSTAIHSYEVTKNNSSVFVFMVTWIADEEFLNSLRSLRNSSFAMTEWWGRRLTPQSRIIIKGPD
jgi:hypothetical protein